MMPGQGKPAARERCSEIRAIPAWALANSAEKVRGLGGSRRLAAVAPVQAAAWPALRAGQLS